MVKLLAQLNFVQSAGVKLEVETVSMEVEFLVSEWGVAGIVGDRAD